MGNIGYCTRGTRMLQIVKGSDLVSGMKQTAAYKVGDEKIISGEPIFAKKDGNTIKWTKENSGSAPFFAFTDSDSFDVIAAGSLLGISVLDTFELQTPLFVGNTFNPGDALTVGEAVIVKECDNFKVVEPSDGVKGFPVNCVKRVAEGDEADIIGYVTEGIVELKGNLDVDVLKDKGTAVNGVYLDGYVDGNKKSEILTGGPSLYTEASGSKFVLQFSTAWKPAAAKAE